MPLVFGVNTSGDLLPVLVDSTGKIIMSVADHNLLDGDLHADTVTKAVTKGGVIVGIDQGGGTIKWDRLSAGTTGQVLTVQSDGSLAWAAAGGGDYVLISDQLLASPAASISFTSIPATYKHLKIMISARSAKAAIQYDSCYVRVNNLSTAIYEYLVPAWYHSAAYATSEGVGQTQAWFTTIPAATAPANAFGFGFLELYDYTNTNKHKTGQWRGAMWLEYATTKARFYDSAFTAQTTAAISQIDIWAAGGNLVTDTRATLYGMS